MSKKNSKYKIRPGQIYLVDSFCSVKHKARVKKALDDGGFIGCLVDKKDIKRFQDAGVPIEALHDEFYVWDFQIIKRINMRKK